MSGRVAAERAALMELLTDALGDLVQRVTIDPAEARPTPGRVAILIEPPALEYETWSPDPVTTWRLDVIAGTMATQSAALDLILAAIDRLASIPLNIQRAAPVTVSLPSGGSLAGYQMTLNPLELEDTNG